MASPSPDKRNYHHGDLAQALIQATLTLLQDKSPAQLSLREVARVAGVSHGAPAHHFGDKAGLFTAVATAGHGLLAACLNNSLLSHDSAEQRLYATGAAYVHFAVDNPAHFSIMFQADLIHPCDPDYLAAAAISRGVLEQCVSETGLSASTDSALHATVVALWSQVHGFASLWLAGNLGNTDDEKLLDSLLAEVLHSLKL